jgi:HEAT repeat protein
VNKRASCIALVVLLLAGAGAVLLDPTHFLLGHLRGESFYQNKPTSYWRGKLHDSAPGVQTNTVGELVNGGDAALPVLIELLQQKSGDAGQAAETRLAAARALTQMGPAARMAVPQLIVALQDEDPLVREVAIGALGNIGADPEHVVAAFRPLLKGKERLAVLKALRAFRAGARDALPELMETIQDPDLEVRCDSAEAIGDMGAAGAPGIDGLLGLMKDQEAKARAHACEALGEIGPPARRALAALRDAQKDQDEEVRKEAAQAIKRIDPGGESGTLPKEER